MTASAIYRGVVEHRRHAPVDHRFSYRLFMLWIDLDEVEHLFDGRWFWSYERANLASFRRADYLGDPSTPLRDAVLDEVEREFGTRPQGPVRMLTQPRCLGVGFNPVTFYYCFDEHDDVEAIVAEITNTPWNERHRYVLRRGDGPAVTRRFRKEFHISPFLSMDQEHDWRFSPPADRLAIHMRNLERGDALFDATLQLERKPWSGRELAKTLALHPFMTGKTLLGIYWQALRLRLKGAPFHEHPKTAEGISP
ncbi:MAG: DUF1365 domain-containing protein [Planctomycetes bacterium]|nr:DUF1365 domain-containing protein [Planctomycetota bacterium]